jgi:hypothetical protein
LVPRRLQKPIHPRPSRGVLPIPEEGERPGQAGGRTNAGPCKVEGVSTQERGSERNKGIEEVSMEEGEIEEKSTSSSSSGGAPDYDIDDESEVTKLHVAYQVRNGWVSITITDSAGIICAINSRASTCTPASLCFTCRFIATGTRVTSVFLFL